MAKAEGAVVEKAGAKGGAACQEDRRYIRSRKMILSAAYDLMQEKGVDGFTVADLTERADLNRSTFYSHFKDKDDLIRQCEEEFLEGLSEIEARIADVPIEALAVVALGIEPLPQLVEVFDYLRVGGPVLCALIGPGGDIGFERRLLDMVSNTIMNKILFPKYRDSKSALVDYYVSYFSNAALGVVRTWLERGMVETSEEMALILIHIAFLKPGEPIEMDGDLEMNGEE